MAIRRILVPVDFSPASLQVLDFAIEFGKPFGAQLTVLFVVEPAYYAAVADLDGTSANLSVLLESQRRSATAQLVRLERRLKRRRAELHMCLQTGRAYSEIVEEAKRSKSDLIIMATHGRGGLSHLLMGSVAERVVRSAPCPVLTLRRVPPRARGRRSSRARPAAGAAPSRHAA